MIKNWIWIITICLHAGWCAPLLAHEKTITIATGEYAPWSSELIQHGGFVNHVVTEAFQKEGYSVHFDYLPWKRAYEMAKNGTYDATSFWADTEEYPHHFHISTPVMYAKVVFFHLRSKKMIEWQTMNDLKRYNIGTLLGETSTKMLTQSGLSVDNAATSEQCFNKLLAGRIDIFPLEILTGLELLKMKLSMEDARRITYHSKPFFETPASVLFSKKLKENELLVKVFDHGLDTMKKEGRYDALYRDLLEGKYK